MVVTEDRNIVLIGMPGVGKSTVGILLAKVMARPFLDTDVYIQVQEGRRLQDIIDTDGIAKFCEVEERHVMSLDCRGHVIATGGSVVYSDRAMQHLRSSGAIVHLDASLALLERRLTSLGTRGVVMMPGQTLADLYRQRQPLYRRHAGATVQCDGLTHDEVVEKIIAVL
jgi:shikimate kinase